MTLCPSAWHTSSHRLAGCRPPLLPQEGSATQGMLVGGWLLRNTLNINIIYTGKLEQSITYLSLPKKRGAGDQALRGHHHQPLLPREGFLMTLVSVPPMYGWGNPYCASLRGVLGSSPSHRGGLEASFLFRPWSGWYGYHMRPQGSMPAVFLRLVQRHFPTTSRFLGRPRLLTRTSPLLWVKASCGHTSKIIRTMARTPCRSRLSNRAGGIHRPRPTLKPRKEPTS
jgi:hypothetical protein